MHDLLQTAPLPLDAVPPLRDTGALSVAALSSEAWVKRLAPFADHLIGLDQIQDIYQSLPGNDFAAESLASLGVHINVSTTDLAHLPATGPVIIASNHPFGAIDGLALLHLATKLRSDVRLMGNSALSAFPELRNHLLSVDVFGSSPNIAALRSAIRHLRTGGCLILFPAGQVSRLQFDSAMVADGPWSSSLAYLQRKTDAKVIPVHFFGHNSVLFQMLGRLHTLIGTGLLPREMLRMRDQTVHVRIGKPISRERLAHLEDKEAATYLRARSYLLAQDPGKEEEDPPHQAEIACVENSGRIQIEIDLLPASRTLAQSGSLRALLATAAEVPTVLREIGRLREITFRAAGEGTGQSRDIDAFDDTYLHLFIWDDATQRILGAYRLGLTDQLTASSGVRSLYTSTLFTYDPKKFHRLVPGIELGRSFVRPECQKDYAPLLLLWRGIGAFVVRNPHYNILFGTVSISDNYPTLCRTLMMKFLSITLGSGQFFGLAQANTPPKARGKHWREAEFAASVTKDPSHVDELIAAMDPHGRGMPVLLRQYLRLGAQLLGFNIDNSFGKALDALLVVDLARAPEHIVSRYMGKEGYASFIAAQRSRTAR